MYYIRKFIKYRWLEENSKPAQKLRIVDNLLKLEMDQKKKKNFNFGVIGFYLLQLYKIGIKTLN